MSHRLRRRIFVVGLGSLGLLALVVGALVARELYRSYRYDTLRDAGLAAFASKDYEAALAALSPIVGSAEESELRLAFAESRMKVPLTGQRHLKMAARVFGLVDSVDPGNMRALEGLLSCVTDLAFLPEMKSTAERILVIDPSNVDAREALMRVGIVQGRWQDAVIEARALQQLEPNEIRWRAAEVVCLGSSGTESAELVGLVRGWIEALGRSPGLRIIEADVLSQTGDRDGCRRILSEIASTGVSDLATLEALIAALETVGLSAEVDQAIVSSKAQVGDVPELLRIDGERLIRSGRIEALKERYGEADPTTVDGFRVRFAIDYLTGRLSEAAELLKSRSATTADRAEPLLAVARLALSVDGARTVERITEAARDGAGDPLVSIVAAEKLMGAGDADAGLQLLALGFERSGRLHHPVGIRVVRVASQLGRSPIALEVARDLSALYPDDAFVALAILEAWSGALTSNYRPDFTFGMISRDDPQALWAFWDGLGRPAQIAAELAQILARRGDVARAREVIEEFGITSDSVRELARFVPVAGLVSRDLQDRLLVRAMELAPTGMDAIVVAEQLRIAGKADMAISMLEAASKTAESDEDRRRIARWQRASSTTAGGSWEWLRDELEGDLSLECAEFALSRPELWNESGPRAESYRAILDLALENFEKVLGESSPRVVLARAARDFSFANGDPSTYARVASTLAAYEAQFPDSVSGRLLYARTLENLSPPDFVRAAAVLTRATELEPGRLDLYSELARILQRIGDYAGASLAIENYAKLGGSDPEAARVSAQMRESIGQFSEAAALRTEISDRSRGLIDRLAKVQSVAKAGRIDEAEAELRALLVDVPDAYIGRELAVLLARSGRLVAAREALRALEARVPGMPIDLLLAELELNYGNAAVALDYSKAAAERQPGNPSDLILARAQMSNGDLVGARATLLRAIERAPSDAMILPVASAILVADASSEGREMLGRVTGAGGNTLPELIAAVKLYSSAVDELGAVRPTAEHCRSARALTTQFPNSALIYIVATEIHASAGEDEEAARIALLGHSRMPLDETLAETAVSTCMRVGRIADAAAVLSVWRRSPGAEVARVDAAEARLELVRRNPARSIALLRKHVDTALMNDSAREQVETYVVAATLAGAVDEVERVIVAVRPEARRALIRAALFATSGVEPKDALPVVRIASKHSGPTFGELAPIAVYATAICREGMSDGCIVAASLLDRIRTDALAETEVLDAVLLAARGESSTALELNRRILGSILGSSALDPEDLLARWRSGPSEREQILADPRVVPVLHNLTLAYLDGNIDRALGLRYATVLHAMFSDSSAFVETYCRALVAANRLQEARQVAQECADPLVRSITLAEIAVKAGDASAARDSLLLLGSAISRLLVVPKDLLRRLDAAESSVEELIRASAASQQGG